MKTLKTTAIVALLLLACVDADAAAPAKPAPRPTPACLFDVLGCNDLPELPPRVCPPDCPPAPPELPPRVCPPDCPKPPPPATTNTRKGR